MARQTFTQVIADVQRKPGLSRLSVGQIADAVQTAAKDLGNEPWPWNYAETNVLVPPPYATGLIDVTDQTNVVNGTAGSLPTWNTSWYGRRIRFSGSNLDYVVTTIVNPTQLLLSQPVNLGQNIAGGAYTLYQDTFVYPSDYIVGSDVGLFQPVIRTRIPKIPRYKFEMYMNSGLRSMSTNIQMFYCDHGEDLTTGQANSRLYRFRLGPPPAGNAELRLCYHQQAPDMVLTQTTTFPDGFDEIIALTAASRLYDYQSMPGESTATKAIAAGKIRRLARQISTQTIDDVPASLYEVPDSSISQYGMLIARP